MKRAARRTSNFEEIFVHRVNNPIDFSVSISLSLSLSLCLSLYLSSLPVSVPLSLFSQHHIDSTHVLEQVHFFLDAASKGQFNNSDKWFGRQSLTDKDICDLRLIKFIKTSRFNIDISTLSIGACPQTYTCFKNINVKDLNVKALPPPHHHHPHLPPPPQAVGIVAVVEVLKKVAEVKAESVAKANSMARLRSHFLTLSLSLSVITLHHTLALFLSLSFPPLWDPQANKDAEERAERERQEKEAREREEREKREAHEREERERLAAEVVASKRREREEQEKREAERHQREKQSKVNTRAHAHTHTHRLIESPPFPSLS